MNTYLVKTEGLDLKLIDNMFKKRGNWKIYNEDNEDKYVNFIHLDMKYFYNKSFYNLKSEIRNVVNENKYSIADKNNLYQNLNKLNSKICQKYMMKQHYLDIKQPNKYKSLFDKNNTLKKIWILKPVEGYAGKGIVIITSYQQFEKTLNSLDKRYKKWVLAQYLEKPLLFKDRKFHLRMYFLYTNDGKKSEGFIHKIGEVAFAKNKYQLNNFNNPDIHDTHFKGMETDYYFPQDFIKENIDKGKNKKDILKTIANIYLQLIELFKHIFKLIDAKCYKETKKCYELFGCDIMITEDYKIKLLEINTKIGYDSINPKKFTELYFGGVLEQVVDNWLPPKIEQKKNNYFLKVS